MKKLKITIMLVNIIILFASCFRSNSSNNNLEYESQAADSLAADTIYSEITEDFTEPVHIKVLQFL